MTASGLGLGPPNAAGLLVDTNLLVLLVVGSVNRDRIETFKRTSQYSKADHDLVIRVLGRFRKICTVAHVLAEVSNLTDLTGAEKVRARNVLRETISLLDEVEMPSARAAEDRLHQDLGLTDAAIGSVARAHNCSVLTDDLALYLQLTHDGVNAHNFTYLREGSWGI
ncbi:MAG: PIN domain-containing protein [Bryobacteraceae bacterium]|jgi:predicted nucleic acid-binding protein